MATSSYFENDKHVQKSISDTIHNVEVELGKELILLNNGINVHYVYNPLDYASAPHLKYLEMFASAPRKVMFLGMNPGPWGMGQTGVSIFFINFICFEIVIKAENIRM